MTAHWPASMVSSTEALHILNSLSTFAALRLSKKESYNDTSVSIMTLHRSDNSLSAEAYELFDEKPGKGTSDYDNACISASQNEARFISDAVTSP
jgi:hypothetical protein